MDYVNILEYVNLVFLSHYTKVHILLLESAEEMSPARSTVLLDLLWVGMS